MTLNNPFPQPICETIWNEKYRLVTPNPDIKDDESVQDTWRRIATSCAQAVPTLYGDRTNSDINHEALEASFYNALEDFKYLPAGRIIAGAGSARNVTLFICFVMGTIPDSIDGIY